MKNLYLKTILVILLIICFGRTNVFANTISDNTINLEKDICEENDICLVEESQEYGDGIEGFVTRLYKICLNREPDEAGFQDWVQQLNSGNVTGADVAYGFVFSQEFKSSNPCNDCYVTSLYRCFLGREPDENGKLYWLDALNNGNSRGMVFNGFALSDEFTKICSEYGIIRGDGNWSIQNFLITDSCSLCGNDNKTVQDFITRLYEVCLDREPEISGLNDWIAQMQNGKTGADVAYGFIFSEEFKNKGLNDEQFIEYMYKAFFGRDFDKEGKNHWLKEMANGKDRLFIFAGFVGSQEFKNLCSQYGVQNGNVDNYIKETLTNHTIADESLFSYNFVGNDQVIITGYFGSYTELYLPQTIAGKQVMGIADDFSGVFALDNNVTKVVIPEGYQYIGQCAFRSCKNLKYIQIPSTLTTIKSGAFIFCESLKTIIIPDNVIVIDDGVFNNLDMNLEERDLTIIICSKGSAAEAFAIRNNFPYIIQ